MDNNELPMEMLWLAEVSDEELSQIVKFSTKEQNKRQKRYFDNMVKEVEGLSLRKELQQC